MRGTGSANLETGTAAPCRFLTCANLRSVSIATNPADWHRGSDAVDRDTSTGRNCGPVSISASPIGARCPYRTHHLRAAGRPPCVGTEPNATNLLLNSRASCPRFNDAYIRRSKAVDHRLVCYRALSVFRAKRGIRQASLFPDETDCSPRRRTRPAPAPQLSTSTHVLSNSLATGVPLDTMWLSRATPTCISLLSAHVVPASSSWKSVIEVALEAGIRPNPV